MRRALIGSISAVALASLSSMSLAADMVPPEPVPSWSGIYVGAGGGIQWGDLEVSSRVCELVYDRVCSDRETFENEFDDNDSSFVGVVQGGYDLQIGQYFVTGSYVSWTFGDGLGSDHRKVLSEEEGFSGKWNTEVDNMLTVAGRQGFLPMPNLMVYGLAGWSWANIDHKLKIDCDECDRPLAKVGDSDFNANGVTVGIGAEYKFFENLSLRGEYRFTDLESNRDRKFFDIGEERYFAKSEADVNVNQVLFTLNYRFGGALLPF